MKFRFHLVTFVLPNDEEVHFVRNFLLSLEGSHINKLPLISLLA